MAGDKGKKQVNEYFPSRRPGRGRGGRTSPRSSGSPTGAGFMPTLGLSTPGDHPPLSFIQSPAVGEGERVFGDYSDEPPRAFSPNESQPEAQQPSGSSGRAGGDLRTDSSSTEDRPVLRVDSKASGFIPHKVAKRVVTDTVKKCYYRFVGKWQDLRPEEKERMFNTFKENFTIDPREIEAAKKAFNYRAGRRLQQLYDDIKKGKTPAPSWITTEQLGDLKRYWATEEYKARSASSKRARTMGRGGNVHTGGSASLGDTRARLEKTFGRPPTEAELFRETHTYKSDKTKWVDARSEETAAAFEAALTQAQSQQSQSLEEGSSAPPPINEEEIWRRVSGGRNRGRVYGRGTELGVTVKGNPIGSSGSGSAASVSAENDQLRETVFKLNQEMQQQAVKWEMTNKKHKKQRDKMKKLTDTMKDFMRIFSGSASGTSTQNLPPFQLPSFDSDSEDDESEDDEHDQQPPAS